jgi:hypothetical protein
MMERVESTKQSYRLKCWLRVVSLLMAPMQIAVVGPAQILVAAVESAEAPEQTARVSVKVPFDPTAKLKPNRALPKIDNASGLHLSDNPSDAELSALHVFREPLIPIGGSTSAPENRALADAITAYAGKGDPEQTDDLTNFFNQFPGSSWEASLLANLGAVWRSTG